MIEPRLFIRGVYISSNLDEGSGFSYIQNALSNTMSITGTGSIETFKMLSEFSNWRGGNILRYIILDNSIKRHELDEFAKGTREKYPYSIIFNYNKGISNDGIKYWLDVGVHIINAGNIGDLVKGIGDDLMDLDWEKIMWSRTNIDNTLNELNDDALYGVEMLLYYLEKRGETLPDWVQAFREIMHWQSLSIRSGVWQHYDGPMMNNTYKLIYDYILKFGPGYRELAKVYLSAVGKNGSNSTTDKIDSYIADNEDLINRFLGRVIEKNKQYFYNYSVKICGV